MEDMNNRIARCDVTRERWDAIHVCLRSISKESKAHGGAGNVRDSHGSGGEGDCSELMATVQSLEHFAGLHILHIAHHAAKSLALVQQTLYMAGSSRWYDRVTRIQTGFVLEDVRRGGRFPKGITRQANVQAHLITEFLTAFGIGIQSVLYSAWNGMVA